MNNNLTKCFINLILFQILLILSPASAQFTFGTGLATTLTHGTFVSDTLGPVSTVSNLGIYGGWSAITLPATGFFHTYYNGSIWFIVDPEGHPFITIGINSVETGGGRILPKDLKDIGANTVGKFSSYQPASGITKTRAINFMSNFIKIRSHLQTLYSQDIVPVFEPDFSSFCNGLTQGLISQKDDPWLFGYFFDNELPFYKNQLSLSLALSTTDPQFKAADAWMITQYGSGYLKSQITITDEESYMGYVAETYYRITTQALKLYDPNHMALGTRIHGGAKDNIPIIQAVGKFADIISINYYNDWEPRTDYMDMWLSQGNKPFFITEFYVKGDDTGLSNIEGAGWVVRSQSDRSLFYENWCLKLLSHPGSVGWHWFRYIDNNGSNKGLLDQNYNWYEPLRTSFANISKDVYRLRSFMLYGNTNYNGWPINPTRILDVEHPSKLYPEVRASGRSIFVSNFSQKPFQLVVYDLQGKQIQKWESSSTQKFQDFTINNSRSNGIYSYKLTEGNEVKRGGIILSD